MRRSTSSLVRNEFTAILADRLPCFRIDTAAEVPPGCAVYRCAADTELTFFIMFEAARRHEAFTLDIAWSLTGSYPTCFPSNAPDDIVNPRQFRMRLSLLWRTPSDRDFWWELVPRPESDKPIIAELKAASDVADPQPRLRQLVVDAIDQLCGYGIPLYNTVAAKLDKPNPCTASQPEVQ